ncbi:MAG: bifunctional serine/threonine-protein kinase/formylglycine-generating enzyme family protein, partial [Cyanobacteria bacterium P01_A01_bin.84]
MQICQNSRCSNPFNADSNNFCISCGKSDFGELLRNRYRVLRLIGEGGFSRTYAAEDADRLNAPCVIKQFSPQTNGTNARIKAAELFKEEAFRLYELGENHLQIPRLLAFFEQGTSLYLVQEFIHGENLYVELQNKAFTEKQIRQLLADLLPVLEFIHSRNVIHRDIKPENIIRRHSDRKMVLIDFGGAKQVTQNSLARQATAIYTVGYAPNEQMAGYPCNASDLYALGVTCIRLLTQCLPIQDDFGNFYDPLYDPMSGQWLWRDILAKKSVRINDKLGEILDKLLRHLATERYQSANEVLQDLQKLDTLSVLIPVANYNSSNSYSSHNSNQKKEYLNQSQEEFVSLFPTFKTFQFDVVKIDPAGREVSRQVHTSEYYTEEINDRINIEMISIPGGSFMMGSRDYEGDADERPQHQVNMKPFFMGKYPITQAQWKVVSSLPIVNYPLNPHPSKFKGANRPVENISWYEAQEFCRRLSRRTGRDYRLPSEAEWEYACRAGTSTPFHFGETI